MQAWKREQRKHLFCNELLLHDWRKWGNDSDLHLNSLQSLTMYNDNQRPMKDAWVVLKLKHEINFNWLFSWMLKCLQTRGLPIRSFSFVPWMWMIPSGICLKLNRTNPFFPEGPCTRNSTSKEDISCTILYRVLLVMALRWIVAHAPSERSRKYLLFKRSVYRLGEGKGKILSFKPPSESSHTSKPFDRE